jgi:hypothetical protein
VFFTPKLLVIKGLCRNLLTPNIITLKDGQNGYVNLRTIPFSTNFLFFLEEPSRKNTVDSDHRAARINHEAGIPTKRTSKDVATRPYLPIQELFAFEAALLPLFVVCLIAVRRNLRCHFGFHIPGRHQIQRHEICCNACNWISCGYFSFEIMLIRRLQKPCSV